MPDVGVGEGAWELLVDTSNDAASESVAFGGAVDGRSPVAQAIP